jgi:simple sugar transport system permease protein
LAGLGVALVLNNLTFLPGFLLIPLGILGAAAFGGAWAAVPGYLQAKRGSHIVITTIMFNWLASVLIVYLLVNVLREPQSMNPETRAFPPQSHIPFMHDALAIFGIEIPASQLNLTLFLALAASYCVWLLIYRSRLGYAIRVVGSNPTAAVYAGISPARITIIAMVLSGALAGGLAVNELMGYQHRLLLEFTAGYGFVGIAVALMGRAHPVGIILASLLFGILYQGGAELAFEQPAITRDMVVVIGGIIILFAGALDGLFRRVVARVLMQSRLARA